MLSSLVWSGEEVVQYVRIRSPNSKQPSGVDLTVDQIYAFAFEGILEDGIREMPVKEILPDKNGYWRLERGAYLVRYGEIVEIPRNAIGLVFSRSSLMRIGCTIQTAVWDPGYRGRGVGLLIVMNPYGVRIKRGSRIAQLIFISSRAKNVYSGRWQEEGIKNE